MSRNAPNGSLLILCETLDTERNGDSRFACVGVDLWCDRERLWGNIDGKVASIS